MYVISCRQTASHRESIVSRQVARTRQACVASWWHGPVNVCNKQGQRERRATTMTTTIVFDDDDVYLLLSDVAALAVILPMSLWSVIVHQQQDPCIDIVTLWPIRFLQVKTNVVITDPVPDRDVGHHQSNHYRRSPIQPVTVKGISACLIIDIHPRFLRFLRGVLICCYAFACAKMKRRVRVMLFISLLSLLSISTCDHRKWDHKNKLISQLYKRYTTAQIDTCTNKCHTKATITYI